LAQRVCVIDIGSNSVRMVIYEKTSRFSFHILHEAKSKVRISQNSYQNNNNLQAEPMQRAFNALEEFLSISKSFKVRKMLCVATSAVRDAPNKQEFISNVSQKLKLKIKVIDGAKEAYFGALACANLLPKQSNALSVDIGGGSTEFALIDEYNISHTLSLALGTVRIQELYLKDNLFDEARKYIDKQLATINDSINPSQLIAIGGTLRALSNAIMQESSYPLTKLHAFEYDTEQLLAYIKKILKADTKELALLHIDENRLDIIKSGVLIVERILLKFNIKKIITSGVGVREGVYVADLLRHSKGRFPLNYNPSMRYILDRYVDDSRYSNQLNKITKNLFDLTHSSLDISKKHRKALSIAAKLYPAGASIHLYSQNKHSYYLIQTALEYGYTHKEIILIATIVKYATKKSLSNKHMKKYKELLPSEKTVQKLSMLLSIAIALLSHRPRNIDFKLSMQEKNTLLVESPKNLYLAQDRIKKLSLNKDFKIKF